MISKATTKVFFNTIHLTHFQKILAFLFLFPFSLFSTKILCYILKFYFVHIPISKFKREEIKRESIWLARSR
jgi:antibiotic biosynthesis monooxygenase (ABM) superfamily enzyme